MKQEQKKQMLRGIANVLHGANTQVTEPVEPTATPAEPSGDDLISTLGDEQLREQLHEGLVIQRKSVKRGRPIKNPMQQGKFARTTLCINIEQWEKMKTIAVREELLLRDLVDYAFAELVARYESKHGELDLQNLKPARKNVQDVFN